MMRAERTSPVPIGPGVFAAFGITAAILWCKLMGHSPGFLLASAGLGDWANARVFWLIGILICAVVCMIIPKRARRFDAVLRYMLPLVAAAGAVTFALSFRQDFFDQRTIAVVGIVASGFGYFWFVSRFVLLLSMTQGLSCVVWSFAAAFPLRQIALAALDATMTLEAQVLVAMALPLVSALMFELSCASARRNAAGEAAGDRSVFGVPTLPRMVSAESGERRYLMVMVVAVALLLSVVRACSISGMWGTDHTIGLEFWSVAFTVAFQIVTLGLFGYFAIIRAGRHPVAMRFQLGILLVMASLIVAALRSSLSFVPPFLLDSIVNVNDPFALLLFWSTVAIAIDALNVPANRMIGLAGAVYAAASILWVVLITGENAVDSAFVLVVIYALFMVFMVCSGIGRRSSERSGAGTPRIDSRVSETHASGASDEGGTCGYAPSDCGYEKSEEPASELLARAIDERCDEVSDQYGLSPRERDVLLLLVQGRTGGAIQDELTLAASTVKTHMQHIYVKVGVSDRQQLMDKVLNLGD